MIGSPGWRYYSLVLGQVKTKLSPVHDVHAVCQPGWRKYADNGTDPFGHIYRDLLRDKSYAEIKDKGDSNEEAGALPHD